LSLQLPSFSPAFYPTARSPPPACVLNSLASPRSPPPGLPASGRSARLRSTPLAFRIFRNHWPALGTPLSIDRDASAAFSGSAASPPGRSTRPFLLPSGTPPVHTPPLVSI